MVVRKMGNKICIRLLFEDQLLVILQIHHFNSQLYFRTGQTTQV